MSVTIAVAGLVIWVATWLLAHAAVIRAGCAQLDERVPGWGSAVGIAFGVSLGAFLLTLPLGCGIGCTVGWVSTPVAWVLQTLLGVAASGWLLAKLLDVPLYKALSIQTVWSLLVGAMTAVLFAVAAVAQAVAG